MPGNTFGQLFRVTTFGESHGLALGCIIDGCPAGVELSEADLQGDLDRRKPGTSKYVTPRREADEVQILSGVFEGRTTGTPIGLLIHNTIKNMVFAIIVVAGVLPLEKLQCVSPPPALPKKSWRSVLV